MDNRAGHLITNLSGEMAYKSFVPTPLPPKPSIELTEDMINLLIKKPIRSLLFWKVLRHVSLTLSCSYRCMFTKSSYVLAN